MPVTLEVEHIESGYVHYAWGLITCKSVYLLQLRLNVMD